ncbi:lipocalin family protein [Rhizobium sp. XQZ8]|uniref:lipocalin family protein n=1 Tax=Rhizobium populisoli TaxID=2859785 RepID=UPI001CA4C684|nr:lipocalin family protein [Rhizobium populisoli]MBW6420851.1 lipocalin family protein [Rhizobium populisoli]
MIRKFPALFAALILAGCTTSMASSGSGGAPQPLKRIDAARFYSGTWLEVARRPMLITNGCVAGTTSYGGAKGTSVAVKDACRDGNPGGREKSITGDGTIIDMKTNAKLRVRYNAFATREYWIIDRAADYSWFIEASPDFRDLYIFTRKVPSKRLLDKLVARAAALGYDTSKLEFPEQPPR